MSTKHTHQTSNCSHFPEATCSSKGHLSSVTNRTYLFFASERLTLRFKPPKIKYRATLDHRKNLMVNTLAHCDMLSRNWTPHNEQQNYVLWGPALWQQSLSMKQIWNWLSDTQRSLWIVLEDKMHPLTRCNRELHLLVWNVLASIDKGKDDITQCWQWEAEARASLSVFAECLHAAPQVDKVQAAATSRHCHKQSKQTVSMWL